MYTHWQKLEMEKGNEDPFYRLFIEHGYVHRLPTPIHANAFLKPFIYHNGIRFYLLSELKLEHVKFTIILHNKFLDDIVDYSQLNDLLIVKMEKYANTVYNDFKFRPLMVYNKDVEKSLYL